jgi:plastocyanin
LELTHLQRSTRSTEIEYVAIATGGNQSQLSANGDAVWVFSLKGQLGPLWPPPVPQSVAGPAGPIADGVDTIKIGDNNVEYSYGPARTQVKAGAAVTFTNVGDVQHTATAFERGNWDTGGVLEKGQSKTVTFSEPGNYYYICTPVDVRADHRRVNLKSGESTRSSRVTGANSCLAAWRGGYKGFQPADQRRMVGARAETVFSCRPGIATSRQAASNGACTSHASATLDAVSRPFNRWPVMGDGSAQRTHASALPR